MLPSRKSRIPPWPVAPPAVIAAILTSVVAAAVAIAGLGPGFVLGTSEVLRRPEGDLAQHTTGALFFLSDQWRFPVFHVPALDFPAGANVAFTDSIPLIALVARPVASALGEPWYYLSGFIFLSVVLQGPAFVILLRQLGVERASDLVAGGLLAALSPALLSRFGHAALCGQFLVVLALAVHFRVVRRKGGRRALGWYVPLASITLLVHPYLMAMVLAVFGASILQLLWDDRLSLGEAGAWAAATVGVLVVVMFAGGHIGGEELVPRPYGDYGLNLLSPFASEKSGLFPTAPGVKATGYLGVGALLLLFAAIWLFRSEIGERVRSQFPLVLVGLGLAVYALTYAVYAGPHLVAGLDPALVREVFLGGSGLGHMLEQMDTGDLLRIAVLAAVLGLIGLWCCYVILKNRRYGMLIALAIPVVLFVAALLISPAKMIAAATQFQASDRFIWPVVYAVMATSVAAVSARLPRIAAIGLLAAALVLQWFDTAPLRADAVERFVAPPESVFQGEQEVRDAFAEANAVLLVPDFACAMRQFGTGGGPRRLKAIYDRLHLDAAQTGTPINSMRSARTSTLSSGGDDCLDSARYAAPAGANRAAWVFVDLLPYGGPAIEVPRPANCRAITIGSLCGG